MDLQKCIIRWDRLERDICMPAIASKLAWFCYRINNFDRPLLLLNAADDTDLVAELTVCFGDRMDVKSRFIGLHKFLLAMMLHIQVSERSRKEGLTLPVSLESFFPKARSSSVVVSWFLRKTTPRSDTRRNSVKISHLSQQRNLPVIARSRIRVSAFGELRSVLIWRLGISRPIVGVESKCSYESKDPEYIKGLVICGRALALPPRRGDGGAESSREGIVVDRNAQVKIFWLLL